jgi:hypothetical protein
VASSAGYRESPGAVTNSPMQDEWLGPWPFNLVGRQWKHVLKLSGWKRVLAVSGVGCEVAFIVAVLLLLVL